MRLVYPGDYFSPREPDEAYAAEAEAARRLGIPFDLVDAFALDELDARRAVRRVPERAPEETAIYRGWMLTPAHYRLLYDALASRGVRLLADPDAYRHVHELPGWYGQFAEATPRSVWLPTTGDAPDLDEIMALLRTFGERPVIVKDYVKSRKHEWEEACFIPSAADRSAVERVTRRFVELQGRDLRGGLVFREFVDLEPLGAHPKSGMPLTEEHRLFVFRGEVAFQAPYWEGEVYGGGVPPPDLSRGLARRASSPFFTMDVARKAAGGWTVIELGDGQVAGLPERADPEHLYRALQARWPA